ncbi:MAG: hypothetical protein CL866_00320 [Cycloclasticus sp.]|nr:hypothetical protein [Cycloclasticus sp.]MBG95302.1 hypothetical protein [Cycloclasticus sp.]HAI96375.1 hypothetical protein [Methylococcaceae bacterium]|tara:strand:- start:795 stop:1358 length:564 start_codon:yes stop_codon:yes gene_type:complete
MTNIPEHYQDAHRLLTKEGFKTSQVWYHGTSTALADAILSKGLIRSGDRAMNESTKNTMTTIGNPYAESIEPVFLTQSKELAYFWAQQTVQRRCIRFKGEENPLIISIHLPDNLKTKVRPDVGAASLLMIKEGEAYMAYLTRIYQRCKMGVPDIDLKKAERYEYLKKLGMAYLDEDIEAQYLSKITG